MVVTVKWAKDSQAAGRADAAKGGFQEWALSGVGLFTIQGLQHLLFLLCLRKPSLDSKCDQEVKVSVAHLRLPLFHY